MKKIESEKNPIYIWCQNPEDSAISQLKNAANLPFLHHHLAVMPDVHAGKGVSIGSILALDGYVIPNAVGVDIGCGMHAVRFDIKVKDLSKEEIIEMMRGIRAQIPLGFEHQKNAQPIEYMPDLTRVMDVVGKNAISYTQNKKANKQLGTLGGGNHFIELQKDEENFLWLMIHSGSRNLGLQIAEHYNKVADKINEVENLVPKEYRLSPLKASSIEGQSYLAEMDYALMFAKSNRQLMSDRIVKVISNVVQSSNVTTEIDIHHNFASLENHFSKDVYVHRKGATKASLGTIGIIPGSQGSASYIVKGKGSPESFESCSHGAGRVLSRTAAVKTLNLQDEIKKLNDQGIIHAIRGKNDLEEAASAYKNIDVVMSEQTDLVEIVHKLSPIAVVKG